jgi:hypothetical protein
VPIPKGTCLDGCTGCVHAALAFARVSCLLQRRVTGDTRRGWRHHSSIPRAVKSESINACRSCEGQTEQATRLETHAKSRRGQTESPARSHRAGTPSCCPTTNSVAARAVRALGTDSIRAAADPWRHFQHPAAARCVDAAARTVTAGTRHPLSSPADPQGPALGRKALGSLATRPSTQG